MTLMFDILPDFMNKFFEFLAMPVFENGSVHFGWGIIHLLTGFLIMYFILKTKEKYPFILAFLILITFEMVEFVLSYPFLIILRESFFDTFFDIWIGMAGVLVAFLIFRKR